MRTGKASTATTSTAPRRSRSRRSRVQVLAQGRARLDAESRVDGHRLARQGVPLCHGGGAVSARLHRRDVHVAQSESQAGQRSSRRSCAPSAGSTAAACSSRSSRTTCTTRSSRSSCRSCRTRRRSTRTSRTSTTCAPAAPSLLLGTSNLPVRGLDLTGHHHLCRRQDARDVRPRQRHRRAGRRDRQAAAEHSRVAPGVHQHLSPVGRAHVQSRRPLQQQVVHDARQRRRELQHVPGLRRVVRDGHARQLPRESAIGRPASASTICSTGSTSSSIRSHSAPSWRT